MNNFEKIKAMSIEEMAKFIFEFVLTQSVLDIKALKQWLQAESEDAECIELGIEYKRMQSILKRIADLCKKEKDKGFVMSRYGTREPISQGYDLACKILKEMEIEGINE